MTLILCRCDCSLFWHFSSEDLKALSWHSLMEAHTIHKSEAGSLLRGNQGVQLWMISPTSCSTLPVEPGIEPRSPASSPHFPSTSYQLPLCSSLHSFPQTQFRL